MYYFVIIIVVHIQPSEYPYINKEKCTFIFNQNLGEQKYKITKFNFISFNLIMRYDNYNL